jgi:hypothetical protein
MLHPFWEGCFQIIDRTAGASRLSILDNGFVGLGTIEPSRNLEAQGAGDVEIGLKSSDIGGRLWTIQSSGNAAGNLGKFQIIDRSAGVSRMTITPDGFIGIGTVNPLSSLDVAGAVRVEGAVRASGGLLLDATGADAYFGARTAQMLNLWNTLYGIGIQASTMYFRCDGRSPSDGFAWYAGGLHDDNRLAPGSGGRRLMSLDSAGLYVENNASVCSLTIRGGCDLAEPFEMSGGEIPKGSLVVIDEEHEGKLKLAGREYDTRVAGIISGANGISPGISLHQEGVLEGGQNVALSGRVYALADASNGAIKPGDLLTSSSTPGHVMKVTDHARAQGAIVGKAMSALKEGKGTVLVLVGLQ